MKHLKKAAFIALALPDYAKAFALLPQHQNTAIASTRRFQFQLNMAEYPEKIFLPKSTTEKGVDSKEIIREAKKLLEGSKLNNANPKDFLHKAILEGENKSAIYLIKNDPSCIEVEDNKGFKPITLACLFDRPEVLRCLLENGAMVPQYNLMRIKIGNVYKDFYQSAIFGFLVENNMDDLAIQMIEKKVVKYTDGVLIGKDLTYNSIHDNKFDIGKALINSGAPYKDSYLDMAVSNKNLDMTLFLLDKTNETIHESTVINMLKWEEFPHKELTKCPALAKKRHALEILALENDCKIAAKNLGFLTPKEQLDSLIGLQAAKKEIESLTGLIQTRRLRDKLDLKNEPIGMHLVFSGNPGTGKTTVARLLGKIYKDMGLLSEGQLVEASRADLISPHVGGTARKVKDVVREARGGVLFIDEAYSLAVEDSNQDFGNEAISTLLIEMEKSKDLLVVVAGYDNPIDKFINSNEGLKSRFKHKIHFEDYNTHELIQILELMAKKQDYVIDPAVIDMTKDYFNTKLNAQNIGRDSVSFQEERKGFGNARGVRNLFEDFFVKHSLRVAKIQNPSKEDLMTITEEDALKVLPNTMSFNENKLEIAKKELNSMLGLKSVKEKVESLTHLMRTNKLRKELNLPCEPIGMHMVFSGNPGTGKTTVARLLGQIYKEMGFLSRGHVVEVGPADLVEKYVGHTSKKVKEKVREALGGILFIDEAYSLSNDVGSKNSFGQEAIDTLVAEMENYRNNMIVVVAGYKEPMMEFMEANQGLSSRFKHELTFEDYNSQELTKILGIMAKKQNYDIEDVALKITKEYLNRLLNSSQNSLNSDIAPDIAKKFGNARGIRNLLEDLKLTQANRIKLIKNPTKQDLKTLTREDLISVIVDRQKEINLKEENPYQKRPFGFDLNHSTKKYDKRIFYKRNIMKDMADSKFDIISH